MEKYNKEQMKELKSKIIVNKAKCLVCNDIVESKSVHDSNWCSCRGLLVDGGREYLKRSSISRDKFEEMSQIERKSFSINDVFKFNEEAEFYVKETGEEVILIKLENGIEILCEKETGRKIIMSSEYLNATYELIYC